MAVPKTQAEAVAEIATLAKRLGKAAVTVDEYWFTCSALEALVVEFERQGTYGPAAS